MLGIVVAELLIAAGWERIETVQHGLTDTRQLAELGVTRDMIAAQIEAGRWQWVLPRVYATFTGPLSKEAEIVAALLYGGSAAILSHRTAAERWGMVPVAPDGPVHITLPYGTSAISQPPLVVVHRSRAFRHIVVALDPPMTSPADTAIDMAGAEPDVRSAQRTPHRGSREWPGPSSGGRGPPDRATSPALPPGLGRDARIGPQRRAVGARGVLRH
jgi:hypothetical protein